MHFPFAVQFIPKRLHILTNGFYVFMSSDQIIQVNQQAEPSIFKKCYRLSTDALKVIWAK